MANRNKSPLKILKKMERGRIQRLYNFWGVPPTISGTGKATDFIFGGYIYRDNPNKSLLKISEKRENGRGSAQIFWVPPIISGTGKAADFKFCRNIHRVDPNKSP